MSRMKLSICLLSAGLLAALTYSLFAQAARGNASGALSRALKLFPDADSDKDGTLSMPEAFAYLEAHPELKAQVSAIFNAATGDKKVGSKPAQFALGAEGTRVFVCSHSYMIFTADLLPGVAQSAGCAHLKAGQQMIGGSRTLQHWNVPDAQNEAKKALREGRVDVLTLSPQLLLPDEGIDHFTSLGLEKNPGLRVLVQASWAPRDGSTGAFTNAMRDSVTVEKIRAMRDQHHGTWLKQLETQVSALNTSIGKENVFIIPVSEAVYGLRERVAEGKVPGIERQSQLFRDDHGHPSEVLAMLVTYCHFASIYQRSPVGLDVPPSLQARPQAEALNRVLQEIAWETVTSYPQAGVRVDAVGGSAG